jgi:6-pyruvoyltetrahydropterin/6-carboxytetrahydropterin synthase
MFEIEKTFYFEAGHSLVHHDGKCRDPHGHSYVLTVILRADELISEGPKTNMVFDFIDFSAVVRPLIETHLDHKWLNDTLETDSPTAEFIAKWIYEKLEPKLSNLYAISLYETHTSKVTYRKNPIG